jgi:hypothetical protein
VAQLGGRGGSMGESWQLNGGGVAAQWGRRGGSMGEAWRLNGGGVAALWGRRAADCQSPVGLPPGMALGCGLTSMRGDREEK